MKPPELSELVQEPIAPSPPAAERHRARPKVSPVAKKGRHRGWVIRRMLLLADVIGLTLAFATTQLLFDGENGAVGSAGFDALTELLLFLATLPAWVVVAKLYRLYDRDEERTDHTTSEDVVGVFQLVAVGAWLFLAAAWATGLAHPTVPRLLTFCLLAILLVSFLRAGARAICRRSMAYIQNTVIVGADHVGQLIARKFLQHPEYGINVVGFVDTAPKEYRPGLDQLPFLGRPEEITEIVERLDVERVVVAFSDASDEETLELIRSLKDTLVQVDVVPRLFEIVSSGAEVHTVEGLPLVGLPPPRLSRSSRLLKRTMDVALSLVGLILFAPVFATVALLIKLDSPGPVFFRQERMGIGNRTFRIFKFRTMVRDADDRKAEFAHLNKHARETGDPRMFKIPNDPRVTKLGRFLRRYSLDELPQLINVLKGDMSLVGPRPLILAEDRYVEGWARKRLDLKPGMTGLWQVLGRSAIPFEEMVKLDYLYVTTWSLWNDCRLLFRTLPLVLKGAEDVY